MLLAIGLLSALTVVSGVFVPHASSPEEEERPFLSYMAPFLSGGGYSSEALAFAAGLAANCSQRLRLRLTQHGDSFDEAFAASLPPALVRQIGPLFRTPRRPRGVVVCHSEPGAWTAPQPRWPTPLPLQCPPPDSPGFVKVGRTMYETDRLPDGWRERLAFMDEIWVPSPFHRDVFARGGVPESKIVVIGESVDEQRFRPDLEPLSDETLARFAVFGRPNRTKHSVRFLSMGKWEARKNMDAIATALERVVDAELVILTSRFHDEQPWDEKMALFKAADRIVLLTGVPDALLPQLYVSADAFVLASRGEGWGRGYAEAMASGSVVIASNWSGQTSYMTDENALLVPVELVDRGDGHLWANPDQERLEEHMLWCCNRSTLPERRRIGQMARETMASKYSLAALADQIASRVEHLHTSHPTLSSS